MDAVKTVGSAVLGFALPVALSHSALLSAVFYLSSLALSSALFYSASAGAEQSKLAALFHFKRCADSKKAVMCAFGACGCAVVNVRMSAFLLTLAALYSLSAPTNSKARLSVRSR